MKRVLVLAAVLALLVQPGLAFTRALPAPDYAAPDAREVVAVDEPVAPGPGAAKAPAREKPEPQGGGMPGRPVPDKPIPHHEPGQPSRAASYTTHAISHGPVGSEEVIQLTGLDAMVADGLDPLAGNYRLMSKDEIAVGIQDINDHSLNLWTYQDNSIDLVGGSETELAPAATGQRHSLDVTSGDLNGDGIDEQIAAWVDATSGYIYIAVGEMPGSLGRTTSAPAVVAHPDGSLDLAVRGYDDALWHRHYDGSSSSWGEWSNAAGGILLSAPAIAYQADGQFDVFVIGTDNEVYRHHWDEGWSGGWQQYADWPYSAPAWVGSTPELPAPAAVARGGGFDLFRLGPDNTLRWHDGTDWESLGGMLASGPGVVSLGPDHMQVFARGVDEALWYLTYDGGDWEREENEYKWQRLELDGMDEGVTIASAPTAVSSTSGQIRVYVRGSDNKPYWIEYSGSTWEESWNQGDGELASGLGAVWVTDHFELFAQKANGSLQQSSDGASWALLDKPWLPACCLGSPINTRIWGYVTGLTNPVDQINVIDIETGHFLGDGREQIALAYTWHFMGITGIGLRLYDVSNGFRSLRTLGDVDPTNRFGHYYPKIAAGEFDGDAPEEIALAYATTNGGVRVFEHTGYAGAEIAWAKEGKYSMAPYGMNDHISSIKVQQGWQACVYMHDVGGPSACYPEDVGDSFFDDDLSDNVYDTGHSVNDSISTIQVFAPENPTGLIYGAVIDGISPSRNAHVALEILDVDPQSPTPTSQAVEYFEIVYTDWVHPAPERTLGIVAGDFDGTQNTQGTLDDEIALIWDKVWWVGSGDHYEAFFHVLDVEPDTVGISISGHDGRELETSTFGLPSWLHPYPDSAEIVLTAGDFDGDGREEIARTWPRGFALEPLSGKEFWPALYRNLEVLDWEDDWSTSSYELPDWSLLTYQDALAAGDINLDLQQTEVNLQDEIILFDAIYDNIRTYSFDSEQKAIQLLRSRNIAMAENIPILATGDFLGDSVRVGPPTYRVQERVDSVLAVLNMPPKHWDMIKKPDGTYETIQILTEECWTSPYDPKCTHSKHGTREGASSATTVGTQRDWAICKGTEWKFSNTVLLEGSMERSYGAGFSRTEKTITTTTFTRDTTAGYDDAIIYYGNPYKVWEYPILSDDTGEPGRYITVIFPDVSQSNYPDERAGAVCDEGWYAPRHQPYNVWSYDPVGDVRFPDYPDEVENELAGMTYEGTESEFQVYFENLTTKRRTSSQRHGISRDEGVGFEFSGSAGFNIGVVSASKNFENRFKAYTKSNYNWEDHVTDELQASNATYFSAYFASTPSADQFATKAFAYWSKAGPLVIDFQTAPGAGTTWQKYDQPDPAFILPWYGFPNPETLPYPDPNNQGAPPCGAEKQHFSRDVVVDPPFASVGEPVTISATVRNFSRVAANNVVVRFYRGDPASNDGIGEDTILYLDRDTGPETVSITWTVAGAGEQKIYAVIDPDDAIVEEMHDEKHIIDNNMAYGLLQIGAASYFDMGVADEQPYDAVSYGQSGTLTVTLSVPPGNLSAVTRFDVRDAHLEDVLAVGHPFEVVAFQGSDTKMWGEPIESFSLKPGPHDPPAVIAVSYADTDIIGKDEANLTLFRRLTSGDTWEEATCPGYQIHRFPEDNMVAVPVCETGTFVLSDESPTRFVYLPVVFRNH